MIGGVRVRVQFVRYGLESQRRGPPGSIALTTFLRDNPQSTRPFIERDPSCEKEDVLTGKSPWRRI